MINPVLIVGSVAYDNIITPYATGKRILGGSASYGSIACSYFAKPQLVGVVGNDFDPAFIERLRSRGIDLEGLQTDNSGPSFFWEGKYGEGFKTRETLDIQLNVFESFQPIIPDSYKSSQYVMLGNIAPELQSHVLDQMDGSPFVIADTIDLWITIKREELLTLIKRLSMFVINDEEVTQLTGEENVIDAGWKLIEMGPEMAIVKKGAHGALLFHKEGLFAVPAYPVTELRDPTGAGDSFAGAFIGYLASRGKTDAATLRRALFYATATASLTVEAFSCDSLENAGRKAIDDRYEELLRITQL